MKKECTAEEEREFIMLWNSATDGIKKAVRDMLLEMAPDDKGGEEE